MGAIPRGWSDLPFWDEDWPRIRDIIAQSDVPVYPPEALRFRALELVAPAQVKVVILGQDPYHTPGKADGLAFSIPRAFGGRLDSLGNIFKELHSDLGIGRIGSELDGWAAEGVLLLNTALSVPEGQANAHAKLGWTKLVEQVLQKLDQRPCAFVLWGGPAQKFKAQLTHPAHLIVESAHPSPLSARRGFFGSKPFSTVNNWLAAQGHPPIDWARESA